MVTASLWNRKAVSQISPYAVLNHWLTSRIKSNIDEAQVLSVSRAIGWKIWLCVRHEYLASFHNVASLAAPPAVWLKACIYDWASVLATVMSQVNGLPPFHGNNANPSGRLLSVRANPVSSLQTGMLADLIALAKISLMALWRKILLGSFLHNY